MFIFNRLRGGTASPTSEPQEVKSAKASSPEYPAVQHGGSLILAWQVKDKQVLVVGGGHVCHSSSVAHSMSNLTSTL